MNGPEALHILLFSLSSLVTAVFFLYGFNCYYLLAVRRRYASPERRGAFADRPAVAVHLPVYNERYVVARVLESCVRMADAYGRDRVRIVVIDDSDDETGPLVGRLAAEHAVRGTRVEVLRRGSRTGYKAGALQAALESTGEGMIAVFDADFMPPEDFLLRTVPLMAADPGLGVVQCRWDHINGDYNSLTRALSIGIDVHFFVEQPARFAAGCFLNFNGTGGLIRRRALEAAGGWQADTLAEDLDASYRMQLAGYGVLFLRDLACRGEVPPSMPSYVKQQGRWACGSLRTARKLLPRLLAAPGLGLRTRLQGFLHLTYYMVHPLMFVSFLLACVGAFSGIPFGSGLLPAAVAASAVDRPILFGARVLLILAIAACTVAVWLYPLAAVRARGRRIWRNLPSILLLGLIGFGLSLNNTWEAAKALFSRRDWPFARTPKYALRGAPDAWRGKSYQVPVDAVALVEAALSAMGIAALLAALSRAAYGLVPILAVYAAAYALVSIASFLQTGKEGGRRG